MFYHYHCSTVLESNAISAQVCNIAPQTSHSAVVFGMGSPGLRALVLFGGKAGFFKDVSSEMTFVLLSESQHVMRV